MEFLIKNAKKMTDELKGTKINSELQKIMKITNKKLNKETGSENN